MQKHFTGWCLAAMLPLFLKAQPPNNEIFKGGAGDGWGMIVLKQTNPDITKGGTGDGWAALAFTPAGSQITKGGAGDGWANNLFSAAYTNITKGGAADGWHNALFQPEYAGITKGGPADGWASTFQPDIALPVNLLSFDAEKFSGKYSRLIWKTATETNNDRFEIERGNDGINFSKIAVVRTAGNSNTAKTYELIDSTPVIGFNYYRLKQFDKDGRFSYSPARLVRFGDISSKTLRIYPNPAKDWITIELASNTVTENTVINIIALNGTVVAHIKVPVGGNGLVKYNAARLPKAMYIVHVVSASGADASRIVIQ